MSWYKFPCLIVDKCPEFIKHGVFPIQIVQGFGWVFGNGRDKSGGMEVMGTFRFRDAGHATGFYSTGRNIGGDDGFGGVGGFYGVGGFWDGFGGVGGLCGV